MRDLGLLLFVTATFIFVYGHQSKIDKMERSIEILNKYLGIEVSGE
jgi:hypothetical protein